jgi:hypothetical protein
MAMAPPHGSAHAGYVAAVSHAHGGTTHMTLLWVAMDSDQIRTNTNSDVTIYHIYFEFGYEYEYYRIRIQNGYFEFGFTFEYLLELKHRVIMSINFICR